MEFPYSEYQSSKEWSILEKAINELIENEDIKLTTSPEYVMGYIAKQLFQSKSISHPLYKILQDLDAAKIHYRLEKYREDTIMICLTVVGARIEIEVFNNGNIETSIFKGNEDIVSGIEPVNKIIAENRE